MSTFQALFIIVYGISFLSSTSIICSDNDCLNSVIKCSTLTDDICNIECNGNGCFNSTIVCASNKECFIKCNGRNSCSFSTIHAEQSSTFGLYLVAYNPYTVSYSDYYSQFMELTVYLPITSPTKPNIIQGVYNHRYPVLINPTFYSIDHFKNTDVYNVSFSNGVMFYSSNFSKKCRFDSQFSSQSSLYCIDTLPTTTSMSTTIQTMLKESDEMEDETNGDEKKYDSALYYLTKYDILIIICIILVLLLCCVCCLFGFYILGSQHTLSRVTRIRSDGTSYKLSRTNLSSTNSGSSSTNQSKLGRDVGKTHEPFNHSSNPSQEIDLPELHAPPPSEYTNPMTFTEYEEYIKTHFMALQRLSLKQPSNKSNISRNSQRTDGTDTSEISSVPVPAQLSNKTPQQQTPAIRLNVHSETLTGGNNSSSSDEENIFIRYADENTRSDGTHSHNKKPTHIRGSPNIDNQNSMSDVLNKLSTSDPVNLNLNPMSKNSNEHSLELECTFRSRDRGHIEGNSMDSGISPDHDNKCDDKPDADVWSNNLSENMDKFEIVTTPWRGEMSQNQDSPSTMNLHPHIYEKSVLMPKLHDMTSGSSVPTLPTLPASVHRARTTTRRDSEEKMDTVAMDDNKDNNKDKNKYGNNLSPAALHGNNNLSLDSMLPIVKMHSEISISPRQETNNTVYTGYHGHGVELDQEQTPSGITMMEINPPQCTFLNVDNGQDSQSYPTCFLE